MIKKIISKLFFIFLSIIFLFTAELFSLDFQNVSIKKNTSLSYTEIEFMDIDEFRFQAEDFFINHTRNYKNEIVTNYYISKEIKLNRALEKVNIIYTRPPPKK